MRFSYTGALIFSIALSPSATCLANSYSIEDGDFSSASAPLSRQITQEDSFESFQAARCRLKQKEIPLSAAHSKVYRAFFVTTVDRCGWGAALGPIWIVLNNAREYKQIFYSGAYSIERLPTTTHGLYDIVVNQGTAGVSERTRFRFEDGAYKAR